MNRPKKLSAGSKVALVAPSSPAESGCFDIAAESVRFLGLEPFVFESCRSAHGFFAGTDSVRAEDIDQAFRDDSIEGIFCIRGGYGTPRLLNMLDYDMIRNNPKVFLGYSDITALHTALNTICQMTTIHGPMPSTDWRVLDDFTLRSLRMALFSGIPAGQAENPPGEEIQTVCPGKAEGMLVGGNLSLLTAALGSPYEIDTRGKIIFIEDVEERPYRIDRMLTSLALAGKFTDCAGIILGTWSDCEEKQYPQDRTLPLEEIFKEILAPYKKPVINNFRAGHVSPQISLPLGTHIYLDADSRTVDFLEAAAI